VLDPKLTPIYLNDHLAGSTGVVELVRRSLSSNRGNSFGMLLAELLPEIEADRKSLLDLMGRLGVRRNPVKEAAAWAAEKAGRLKLNTGVSDFRSGYSPLSRLVELEGVAMGVQGKLSLWRSLEAAAEADQRLDRAALGGLASRAESQLERLGRERESVARDALVQRSDVIPDPAPGSSEPSSGSSTTSVESSSSASP
jgi:hypothetical protein